MAYQEHILVGLLLVVVIVILLIHHKISEKKYKEIVRLRDAAIDISNHMMDMETSDEGFQYILEKCIELIPDATLGSILMIDEEGYLTAQAHLGFSESHIGNFKILFKESFIYHKTGGVLESVIIVNNLKALLGSADTIETNKKGMYIQSQLTAPLKDGERLIGIVCIDSLRNNVFSENDRIFLEYMMNHINGITRQQYLRERVVYHSRHDCLTKLYNRSYFDEVIGLQMDDLKEPFILCEIDLDDLKVANDIHGHLVGDKLIMSFSSAVNEILKDNEFAGRYGGDEFMICLFESSIEAAEARIEELVEKLFSHKIISNNIELFPNFSYGLVKFPKEGILLDVLLSKSDRRMYEQKKEKKKTR